MSYPNVSARGGGGGGGGGGEDEGGGGVKHSEVDTTVQSITVC